MKRIQYSVCFVSRVQSVNNKFIARDILRRPPRGYSSFEYERTFRRTQPLEAHVHAKYLNAPLSSRASSENQQQHRQASERAVTCREEDPQQKQSTRRHSPSAPVREAATPLRRLHAPMVLLRHISVALTAAMVTLGSAIFIALNYFYPRRKWSPHLQYATIKEVRHRSIWIHTIPIKTFV